MKNRYDLGLPDLTPDLEWMLSSGQVSSTLLLEKLLQDYYPKIFQLAFSILNDWVLAERCAQDIFVKAMLSAHKFSSEAGVEIWLYQLAWQQCQKANQQQKARLLLGSIFSPVAKKRAAETVPPENPLDAHLWQAIDGLGEFSQSVLLLHVLHCLPVEKIGTVVGDSTGEIQAVLEVARQEISARWEIAGREDTELSEALLRLFASRWPAPAAAEYDLEELAAGISRQVAGKQSRIKPIATFLEVSLLVIVVLVAGGFLVLAGRGDPGSSASTAVSSSVVPGREAVAIASSTPVSGYRYRSRDETLLMPRGYDLIPVPTYTPTPDGVLYGSQIGEEYMQIASSLGVALEELLAENRIPVEEQLSHGQLLYIPGSLPELTLRRTTPVPQPTYTLPLETPVDLGAIARLMFPENTTYHTVWFDALLAMNPQRPFSDQQQHLRIQLWLSDDQALLLGGPAGEEPYDVLLWVNGDNYVASPVEASPWFRHAGNLPGESLIDPRLLYGAISFLRETFSYGYPKYQFIGEEPIAGRPSWIISELDEQMASGAVFNIDKQTGFILKVVRNQDDPNPRRARATMPQEAIITAIEFNVDFPQELFNPRFPWRGGYALDHSGKPAPLPGTR